jgi:peptide/nickel transport system permease protein
MKRSEALWLAWAAAGIAVFLLCGEFLAPYPPAMQHRAYPLAPPTPLVLLNGGWVPAIGYRAPRPDQSPNGSSSNGPVENLRLRWFPSVESGPLEEPLLFSFRLFGPSPRAPFFLLGTDELGRDVWSRLLAALRRSLVAGLLAAALALGLGFAAGAFAGYRGGWADALIMRFTELLLTLPWLYLVLAASSCLPPMAGESEGLILLVVILGLLGWAKPARLIRGVVLSERERGFVQSARGFGAPAHYILRRHILPQTRDVLLAQASLLVPQFMLAELALTFLGIGAAPPSGSLGEMLAALQRLDAVSAGWWLWAPAAALVLLCFGFGKAAERVLRHSRAKEIQ